MSVAEEEPHSLAGAVTALSAGTGSAFLQHWRGGITSLMEKIQF